MEEQQKHEIERMNTICNIASENKDAFKMLPNLVKVQPTESPTS